MKAKADIVQSRIDGLAAGAATVAFQLGMNWLHRWGLVQLSHLGWSAGARSWLQIFGFKLYKPT
jgi:hypothetical protein